MYKVSCFDQAPWLFNKVDLDPIPIHLWYRHLHEAERVVDMLRMVPGRFQNVCLSFGEPEWPETELVPERPWYKIKDLASCHRPNKSVPVYEIIRRNFEQTIHEEYILP